MAGCKLCVSSEVANLLTSARHQSGFKEPEGDDAVKVTYGYDKATFYVRKSSVCSGSGFFKTACLAFRVSDSPHLHNNLRILGLRDVNCCLGDRNPQSRTGSGHNRPRHSPSHTEVSQCA